MSRKKIHLTSADKIEVRIKKKNKLLFKDESILGFTEGEVTKFGNSAKINFTKEYAKPGNKVYVVVCK